MGHMFQFFHSGFFSFFDAFDLFLIEMKELFRTNNRFVSNVYTLFKFNVNISRGVYEESPSPMFWISRNCFDNNYRSFGRTYQSIAEKTQLFCHEMFQSETSILSANCNFSSNAKFGHANKLGVYTLFIKPESIIMKIWIQQNKITQ